MHGTIMVFFVAMPLLLAAFGNFLLPLMVGARDMAFPRLNMLSVWIFALASVVLFTSFFVPGGAAAAGWTGYPPLSAKNEYTGGGYGMDLWLLALALEFASFLLGGINFLTTAINMRAPGMTLMRMPMLVWMQLIAAVVFMLSVGPTIAGAILLLMDRNFGTTFYAPDAGGDPLLWQHLFWFFGHPEVYVILLPGLGITLEIICGVCAQADIRVPADHLRFDHFRIPEFPRLGAPSIRQRHGPALGDALQHHDHHHLCALRFGHFFDHRHALGFFDGLHHADAFCHRHFGSFHLRRPDWNF